MADMDGNGDGDGDGGGNVVPLSGRKCAQCGRAEVPRFRPFCSRRCADTDLGRWFKGDYRISAGVDDEDDAEAEPDGA